MDFVVQIYALTNLLPESEKFGLVQQLRRAAVSVPSNIAEGYGRSTRTELARFVEISLGSVREIQTQLEICERLGYLDANRELQVADELGRILYSFSKSLREKNLPDP